MPVYRLEPVAGTEGHIDWRASSVPPQAIWVRADEAMNARGKIQLATVAAYNAIAGQPASYSPWVNPKLTTCDEDTTHDPGHGVALRADGKTFTV